MKTIERWSFSFRIKVMSETAEKQDKKQKQSTIETRTGKLHQFYDSETGEIYDSEHGKALNFYNPDAQKRLKEGEEVSYVLLTTPKGKKIVKSVIKK
ncbi:MAG: hypothetical protein ACO1O6_03935 [Bacteroidota bacterium]